MADMATESAKKKNFVWNDTDNPALYEALRKQISLGRKASGHYTTEAWTEIVAECRKKINSSIDKDKIINRMRTLKDRFVVMRDIKSKIGSGWSEDMKMIQVEHNVWKDLIAEHPKWAPYRYRSFEDLPTLSFLFDESSAGQYATPLSYAVPLIEDVQVVHESSPLLEDNLSPYATASEEEAADQSTPTSSIENKKRKTTSEVRKGKRKRGVTDSFTCAMENLTKAILGLRPPYDIGQKCLCVAKGFDLTTSEIIWATEIFKDKDDCLMFEKLDQNEQLAWLRWKIEFRRLQSPGSM